MIEPNKKYKLSEAAEFVFNTEGNKDRFYVYRLVRAKRLKARNIGLGKKNPLYVIMGSEIINYLKKW